MASDVPGDQDNEQSGSLTSILNQAPIAVPKALAKELESYYNRRVQETVEEIRDGWSQRAPLWTLQQVADYLNVSPRTVDTMVAEGTITPIWIRGQRRFHEDVIDAYVESRVGNKEL